MATTQYFTTIKASGRKEDLTKIIGIMRRFANKEYDVYLRDVRIKNAKDWTALEGLIDESSVNSFISELDGVIEVRATGPLGGPQLVKDARLFERISEIAPKVELVGKTEGSTTYTTQSVSCKLEKGILHLKSFYESNEEPSEEYFNSLYRKIWYNRFVRELRIDEEEYSEDEYEEYITQSDCYDSFMRDNYTEFIDCCPASEISNTEYKQLKKQFKKEGLDWERFLDCFEGGITDIYDYDPVQKEYIK